jgi:hypothetical protein
VQPGRQHCQPATHRRGAGSVGRRSRDGRVSDVVLPRVCNTNQLLWGSSCFSRHSMHRLLRCMHFSCQVKDIMLTPARLSLTWCFCCCCCHLLLQC